MTKISYFHNLSFYTYQWPESPVCFIVFLLCNLLWNKPNSRAKHFWGCRRISCQQSKANTKFSVSCAGAGVGSACGVGGVSVGVCSPGVCGVRHWCEYPLPGSLTPLVAPWCHSDTAPLFAHFYPLFVPIRDF